MSRFRSEVDRIKTSRPSSPPPPARRQGTRPPPDDPSKGELDDFSKSASDLSSSELDRDLAEIKNEIEFLESQVRADIGNYHNDNTLKQARVKIETLRRKLAILELELSKRKEKS